LPSSGAGPARRAGPAPGWRGGHGASARALAGGGPVRKDEPRVRQPTGVV